jgi:hypothetical protein
MKMANVKQGIASIVAAHRSIPLVNKPTDTVEAGELLNERTSTMKVFDAGKGQRRAKIYACQIHFRDIDGKFKAIDTTVKRKPLNDPLQTHQYEVKSGLYHAHFKADKPHDYRLEIGGSWIEYEALFDESESLIIDVETSRIGVKETIVLKDEKAPTSLSWRVTREGTGIVTPPPTAVDADGKPMVVKVTQDKDILTYKVDTTDAVFPIEIDPSSVIATNDGSINGRNDAGSYTTQRNLTTATDSEAYLYVGQFFDGASRYKTFRTFMSYAIPAMVYCSACDLMLEGSYDGSTTDDIIRAFTSTYSNPLIKEDFDQFSGWQASGAYTGSQLTNEWNMSSFSATWNTLTFNSTGLAAVLAAQGGILRIALLSAWDISSSAPNNASYVVFEPSTTSGKEPYLSITFTPPQVYRDMAGQSDIVFDAIMEMYRNRNMAGQADVSFDAVGSCYADKNMQGQADIVFDSSLLLSRIFDMAGQSDIVFDAIMEMYRNRNMAGQADTVFSALAAMYADRNMAGQVNIVFDASLVMWAIRTFRAQSDIIFDALLFAYADRNMTGQADIELSTYMFMGIDGDSGLITRF